MRIRLCAAALVLVVGIKRVVRDFRITRFDGCSTKRCKSALPLFHLKRDVAEFISGIMALLFKRKTLSLFSMALAGCATQPTPVLPDVAAPIVTTVQVPVSQPCVTTIPTAPLWATEVAGLTDEFARVKALLIEREQRRAYVPQIEAILKGCR